MTVEAPGMKLQEMRCVKCGETMAMVGPRMDIINRAEVSMIVFVHSVFDKCPKCQTMHTWMVAGFGSEGIQIMPTVVTAKQPQPGGPGVVAPSMGDIAAVNQSKGEAKLIKLPGE